MPDQVAASFDSIRNLRLIDNGDGSYSIAVSSSGGGGSTTSQVEGTQDPGEVATAKPVVIGFQDSEGLVRAAGFGNSDYLPVFIADGTVNIANPALNANFRQQNVAATPTQISLGVGARFRLVNMDASVTIYINTTALLTTAAAGIPVKAGESWVLESTVRGHYAGPLYAISASGTVRVAIEELS